jgi:hypothetical protein
MEMAMTQSRSKAQPRSKKAKPKTNREKVAAHRAKLRAQGLRPIQIWVPDVRSPEFAAEARRQMRLVARSKHAQEDQDFVDAVTDWGDE